MKTKQYCNIFYDVYYFLNLSDIMLKDLVFNYNNFIFFDKIYLILNFNQLFFYNLKMFKVLFCFLFFYFLVCKLPFISYNISRNQLKSKQIKYLKYIISDSFKFDILLNLYYMYFNRRLNISKYCCFANVIYFTCDDISVFWGFKYLFLKINEYDDLESFKLNIYLFLSENCLDSDFFFFFSSFNIFF